MPTERLRVRELRGVLDFLGELYRIRDRDAFIASINAHLPGLVACDLIGFNEVNPRQQRINYVISPASACFPGDRQALADHMNEHPIIQHYSATRHPEVLKLSDFLTSRELHRLGLYQEYFRRLHVEHMIVAPLPFRPPLQFGFALCRQRGDFSERERLILSQLAPHFAQAYRNAEAVAQLVDRGRLMTDALDTTERGMITLGPDGRIHEMSDRARKWLDRYWSRSHDGSRTLPRPLRQWLVHEDLKLAASNGDLPSPRRPLIVERDGRRLTVRTFLGAVDRVLLLEEERTRVSGATLQPIGLSRRETQVLAWVAEGKTNAEIARILTVRPRTVGKHLEHIYAKLGVETRTAAARVAWSAGE